ncbi:MAG: hypothetical protein JW991_05325 [Candidatus Pacebacteria bacterium]|nr:hypothetical protein [Candidatus Paceibacterota bacterium]
MKNKTSKLSRKNPVKPRWHQGWRNRVVIISFFFLPGPISLTLMWLLANWSKKAKFTVSGLIFSPFPVALLASWSASWFAPMGMVAFLNLARLIYNLCFLIVGVSLVAALFLTFRARKRGQLSKSIWIRAGLISYFSLLIVFFFVQVSARLQYLLV